MVYSTILTTALSIYQLLKALSGAILSYRQSNILCTATLSFHLAFASGINCQKKKVIIPLLGSLTEELDLTFEEDYLKVKFGTTALYRSLFKIGSNSAYIMGAAAPTPLQHCI